MTKLLFIGLGKGKVGALRPLSLSLPDIHELCHFDGVQRLRNLSLRKWYSDERRVKEENKNNGTKKENTDLSPTFHVYPNFKPSTLVTPNPEKSQIFDLYNFSRMLEAKLRHFSSLYEL